MRMVYRPTAFITATWIFRVNFGVELVFVLLPIAALSLLLFRLFDILLGLSVRGFDIGLYGLPAQVRAEVLYGPAERFSFRSRHFGLQLSKGDVEIMGDVYCSHKLPQVFEAARGSLEICSRRQQLLEL